MDRFVNSSTRSRTIASPSRSTNRQIAASGSIRYQARALSEHTGLAPRSTKGTFGFNTTNESVRRNGAIFNNPTSNFGSIRPDKILETCIESAEKSDLWKNASSNIANGYATLLNDLEALRNVVERSIDRSNSSSSNDETHTETDVEQNGTNSSPKARYDLSRGCHVLIFNHKKFKNELNERKGSEKDLELLKIFFNNYQVNELEIYSDFSVEQVKTKMAEIEKKDFKECSCLIVIIMSHGGLGDTIMASDEQSYNLETDIVDRVLDNSTLKDKPKLFFIQACRGNALMETDSFPSVSNKNDIWKLHSTYEGTVSFRDIERGTCFVQTLFDFIETNNDKSLHEISLLLRAEFKNHEIRQVPTETSTLNKEFYFADMLK